MKAWIIEAHDLGALQVREIKDAIILNRRRWLAGEKADRLLVGIGATIDEALEVERDLKRMKGTEAGPARNATHSVAGGDQRPECGLEVGRREKI